MSEVPDMAAMRVFDERDQWKARAEKAEAEVKELCGIVQANDAKAFRSARLSRFERIGMLEEIEDRLRGALREIEAITTGELKRVGHNVGEAILTIRRIARAALSEKGE